MEDFWSEVAEEWALLWARSPDPARDVLLTESGVRPGTRVLDVGCGSGELLARAAALGASVAGVDSAPGMVAVARRTAPDGDVRVADAQALPWPAAVFDVVLAVNALHLADDPDAALAEMVRVTRAGGRVGLAQWAEAGRNDLEAVERAVALAHGEDDVGRDDPHLDTLLREAGLADVRGGVVDVVWEAPDDATLVRAALLGEDAEGRAATAGVVLAAAAPYRTDGGGYRFVDAVRWVVGAVPAR
ncbi:class I SAM-dependent methyltransferase [Cellulomonas telluris]|uniref:class I SAM-dependent methyltransferase n=1 Tax=Cellulomonas telluris TaxID=2306636 RepID=UPI001FEAE045|nr:methyltransferase domain-containing protein [Cellulomonas telluris]